MPVEMIYRMPTMMGVPLTVNSTSVVLPISAFKLEVEVKPGLFTPSALLWKKRDSVEIKAKHRLT